MSPIKLESETKRNFRFSMSGAFRSRSEGHGSIVVTGERVGYYKTLKSFAGRAIEGGEESGWGRETARRFRGITRDRSQVLAIRAKFPSGLAYCSGYTEVVRARG